MSAQPLAFGPCRVLEAPELVKRYGEARGAARGLARGGRGRARGDHRPERRRQDDAALDPRRHPEPDEGTVSRAPGEIGWVPQQAGALLEADRAENLRLFARLEQCADVEARGRADARPDRARATAPTTRSGVLSGGNRQRVNIAIGLLAEPAVLLLDEPSAALDPRQRERLWEFMLGARGAGTTVVYSTHYMQEAERHADQVVVLADGELLFAGPPRELEQAVGARGPRLRGRRSSPSCGSGATDALAAPQGPADPAPLAAARGAARALPDRHRGAGRLRGHERARTSRASRSSTRCRADANKIDLGGETIDARQGRRPLFEASTRCGRLRGPEPEERGAPEGPRRRRAGRADHPAGRHPEAAGGQASRRSSRRRSRSTTTPRTRSRRASSRTRSRRRCRRRTRR